MTNIICPFESCKFNNNQDCTKGTIVLQVVNCNSEWHKEYDNENEDPQHLDCANFQFKKATFNK